MSLVAVPDSRVAISGVPAKSAIAASVPGATPHRRPTHQAARNAIASQPRLMAGERTSCPNATMPTACTTSAWAG